MKIRYNGDNVEIVKSYGDGVSTESIMKELPLRYRIKAAVYEPNGYYKLEKINNGQIEEQWDVLVETEYTMTIDGNHYEVYDITNDGDVIYKYKGEFE